MSVQLLEAAPFLGVYVLMAGCYGLFYCLHRLQRRRALSIASRLSYALHIAVLVGILAWTPLNLVWKVLLVASSAVILVIPPATWRFLEQTHGPEGGRP